jgi:hypothetical protein
MISPSKDVTILYKSELGKTSKIGRSQLNHKLMPTKDIQKKNSINLKWYHSHKSEQQAKMKTYRDRIKDAVFGAYGGYICNCCKETEKSMLCLDHINNDGYEHRKQIGSRGGIGIYIWIVKNNFPDGFQILCYNCNQSKRINGGTCAHKLNRIEVY